MRSLLLRRLSSLSLRQLGGARFVSDTAPCRIVRADRCGKDGEIGKLVISVVKDSPFGEDEVLEKKVPMSLMTETGTIGASHGWVATLKDGVIRLQDDLNPSASDSDPKRITLPPLVTLPRCQTQVVTNVAMSSSSPEDEDCILAVKFLGPQLSLLRLAQKDSEWVNITISDRGFFSSRVMYSKRDKMFSMLGSGGTHMGCWDLEEHILHNLEYPIYHEFLQSQWERVSMFPRTEHLVVSPTGKRFVVKWYTESLYSPGKARSLCQRFLVFTIEGKRVAEITEDIGDLCIFLSTKGEPFCLRASSYGLSKNCIYYVGANDIGKFNIRGNDFVGRLHTSPAPYFIPPQA